MRKTISLRYIIALVLTLLTLPISIFITPATAEAAGWYCGSQCNNKAPNWVVPSNGVQCSNSATTVGQGHPVANYMTVGMRGLVEERNETDLSLTVTVKYSTVCRTIWAVITGNQSVERIGCSSYMDRFIPTFWTSPNFGCPGNGTTLTTNMVDDRSPTGGLAAQAELYDQLPRLVCYSTPGPDQPCTSSGISAVTFSYIKAW